MLQIHNIKRTQPFAILVFDGRTNLYRVFFVCIQAKFPLGKSASGSTINNDRIPNSLLTEINAQAKAEDRSRSKVIVMRLSGDSLNALTQSREDRRIKRTAAAEPLMRVRSQSDVGDSQPRPNHNPKTCRIYKCGMCASLKSA